MNGSHSPQQQPEHRQLAGLDAPITVCTDHYGVAHVTAQSKRDAFFAQGYLAARDRLFQLDLDHRVSLGRMAESFGPEFLPSDRASRLFQYRGDIDAELAAIPAETRECVSGYVAGINARIDELDADPKLLPKEYEILGIAPLRWDLRELVLIRGTAIGPADNEIRRAMLAARGRLDLDHFADPLRPAHTPQVPDGLDLAAVSWDDLGDLGHVGFKPPFTEAMIAGLARATLLADDDNLGSNAWTVAGSRTASGHPILANDPHLAIGGFCPRHVVHLCAPGLNVIGAGFPGQPGIMQGHTDRFAFGRTNFHIDQTDLFVLALNPDDPEEYWHDGAWTRFARHDEIFAVKGDQPQHVTMRYSAQGPVISYQPDKTRAVAAASTSMLPGANMRFAIAAINLADGWDSLDEAFALHVAPTNFHYADTSGNIGWRAIGFAPRRRRHDGLLPAPGDGTYDWDGLIPLEEMPSIFNPDKGWIASANAFNVPDDYPFDEQPLSYTWKDPYRHDRAHQLLEGVKDHTIADSWAMMHDTRSLAAQDFVALIPPDDTLENADACHAAKMLRGWKGDLEAASGVALLYACALTALRRAFHAAVIPEDVRDLIPSVNQHAMLTALAEADGRLGDDPLARRIQLMERALTEGWQDAQRLGGSDPKTWRWGEHHKVAIRHPLAALPAIADAFPAISGQSSGGDGTTLMARGIEAGHGFAVRHGASFLFAADTGNWDEAGFALLPGQSADPASPHYDDCYLPWAKGTMLAMDFSEEAVAASAVSHEIWLPQSESSQHDYQEE